MAFAHLHVHTEYSLLDGSNKIKEYVARVKELGMDSAAITLPSDAAFMIWKGSKFFSSLLLHLFFICFFLHNLSQNLK